MDLAQTPLEEIRNLKLALSRLLESEGWATLVHVLGGQIEARRAALVEHPMAKFDDMLELAKLRGELVAMQIMVGLPQFLIDEFALEVKKREEEDARGSGTVN